MKDDGQIHGHLAQPGPLYWDFRCLVCDQPVAKHVGFVRYCWERFFG